MKLQCIHSDTGLCPTCFRYEIKIAELVGALKEILDQPTVYAMSSPTLVKAEQAIKKKEDRYNEGAMKETPKPASQKVRILEHLKTYGKITPLDALNRYGCFRLSERIRELEKDGAQIFHDRSMGEKKYSVYTYIGGPDEKKTDQGAVV